MKCVIITGGIATGKSTLTSRLKELANDWAFFDADATVHHLLTIPRIVEIVRCSFGEGVVGADGFISRKALGKIVFGDLAKRRLLESILHPEVYEHCRAKREAASASGQKAFIADIPLHFESETRFPSDLVVTIATSPETQLRRLRQRNRLSRDDAQRLLDSQLPILEKARQSDAVIWNEGNPSSLEPQIEFLISLIQHR